MDLHGELTGTGRVQQRCALCTFWALPLITIVGLKKLSMNASGKNFAVISIPVAPAPREVGAADGGGVLTAERLLLQHTVDLQRPQDFCARRDGNRCARSMGYPWES